jgi:hypothetical protein
MLRLGSIVDDCVLVKDGISVIPGLPEPTNDYLSSQDTAWLDLKGGQYFSNKQYVHPVKNAGKDQNFFVPKGEEHFKNMCNQFLSKAINRVDVFSKQDLAIDDQHDFFYSNPKSFEKFKDKKIMIVCGGPSTNEVNWQAMDYDCLWTCNEYYKNSKLQNERVDFVTLAPIVDLESQELRKRIKRDKTTVSFPMIQNYIYDNEDLNPVNTFTKDFPHQTSQWYTRYSSVIGTGVRMIPLAIFAGAKEIYFVGVDGRTDMERDGRLLHSFDGDKPLPSWYKTYGSRFQVRQNVIFWEYMESLKKRYDFSLFNLGEGKEYNSLTPGSKTLCPLPEEVKERIEC